MLASHQPGFTSSLLSTLRTTRAQVDAYVETQMEQADAAATAYETRRQQEQQVIDAQVSSLLSVQQERGLTVKEKEEQDESGGLAKRREELSLQQDNLRNEIVKLQDQRTEREHQLKELETEEAQHRARAEEVRAMKRTVEETKKTTIDDLTQGVVNYKYLGLDFEKADDNRLRFTFTHLDAGEPQRPFSFILNVNSDELYEVLDCEPILPGPVVDKLAHHLNESDELSPFVRGMRNAFSSTL